jgi:hypothetical protein
MSIVNSQHALYPRSIPVFPVIDPAGSNDSLFLLKHDKLSLIQTYNTRDHVFETAPLKVGTTFDLMGNSNMNLLVQSGQIKITDTLSEDFSLAQVFIEVMGELFAIDVSDLNEARAVTSVEAVPQLLLVALHSNQVIDEDSLNYFGEKPFWLPLLKAEAESGVIIEYRVNGSVSPARGTCTFGADVTSCSMGGPRNHQTKFAKLLTESTKVVAFTFKSSVA